MQALTKRRLSGTELVVSDATSMAILKQGLHSPHAGAVVYSMRMLEEAHPTALETELQKLLNHSAPEVRRHALETIARLHLISTLPAVKERVLIEASPEIKGAALRTLTKLGAHDVLNYLDDPQPAIKVGAIVGLLNSDSVEGRLTAHQKLLGLTNSSHASDRVLAAQILGECDTRTRESYLQPLNLLMRDPDLQVRRAALRSAGLLKSSQLWPIVVEALTSPSTRNVASAVLISGGDAVLPEISSAFQKAETDRTVLIQLTKICGRIRGSQAIALLKTQINVTDIDLRSATLHALYQCGYRAESIQVQHWIKNEIAHAAWLSAAAVDLGTHADTALLQSALADQIERSRERVLALLSFSGDAAAIMRARDNLLSGSADKKAYALEVIDIQTPQALRSSVLPLLDELSPQQRLQQLSGAFPQTKLERGARLGELILNSERRLNTWTQACALHTASMLKIPNLSEIITPQLAASDNLIREMTASLQQLTSAGQGESHMLSTIEKVIILKTVSIFAETSDEILAEVAAISTETEASVGETIFEKGDSGDSLYIIASGQVRVHDGDRTINDLVTGNVFGEMAVLDPEPRSASVKAIEDTHLLRLDQQALYELIDDRPEVARGLLKVLSQHLRNRMRDLAELRN